MGFLARAQLVEERASVHDRHGIIRNDQIGLGIDRLHQSIGAIRCGDDLSALLQSLTHQLENRGVVIDNKDFDGRRHSGTFHSESGTDKQVPRAGKVRNSKLDAELPVPHWANHFSKPTRENWILLRTPHFGMIVTAPASALFEQAEFGDFDAVVSRFAHIVNRQRCHGRRCEGLHFDSCGAGGANCR